MRQLGNGNPDRTADVPRNKSESYDTLLFEGQGEGRDELITRTEEEEELIASMFLSSVFFLFARSFGRRPFFPKRLAENPEKAISRPVRDWTMMTDEGYQL